MHIGLLVSGDLGNKIFKFLKSRYLISFVLTDRKSKDIIEEAKKSKIKYFVGNPRNGKGYIFMKNIYIDVIVSVNYIFIIENDIINHAQKIAFNIHGSLLPKYRGRTPHVWAIINNEKMTGITAHRMDEGCDTGDIIEQIEIPIHQTDTGMDILKKFEIKYPTLVQKVLNSINENTIKLKLQEESKATFFGKRNPEGGQINWNWQKERVYNWVRAQAFPYPGAFTFYNGRKVIIDEISYSDLGFNWKDENGLILQINPEIIVKTINGAIKVDSIRDISELNISKGGKFEYL
jgi:methionyl-tRNA formyltransferase